MSESLSCSIEVDLPEDVEAIIEAHEAPEEGSTWTTAIHGALWEMRTSALGRAAANSELEEELREALESLERGEGVEITAEWWEDLDVRAEQWSRQVAAARAQGLIGNLLLPEKLHAFVRAEIATGRFASATDVVSEAVRRCTWHWED
jgi:hypothetical protein